MAASFVAVSNSFICKPNTHLSNQRLVGLRRNSLNVSAISKKWEPSKVVPQVDRVLIRLEALPEKSAGGVLLPKSAVKFERYLVGEILSAGAEAGEVKPGEKPGAAEDLGRKPSSPSFRKVIFSDINAYEVDLGTDEKHCFCKVSDLLAVVE